MAAFEQQRAACISWYLAWSGPQRDALFTAMLERVRRDSMDDLSTAMAFGGGFTEDPFAAQMRMFCTWFTAWSDEQRNAMLDSLELVDQARVDVFIDTYRRIRW